MHLEIAPLARVREHIHLERELDRSLNLRRGSIVPPVFELKPLRRI